MLDETVLVTGASSGIGNATCLELAKEGYTVLGTVRKESDKEMILKHGPANFQPVYPLDLTDVQAIDSKCGEIAAELENGSIPPLSAIVFIAGGGHIAPIELMDIEGFRKELDVRVIGTVRIVQNLLPELRKTKGRIVWIATPGIFPVPFVADIHACDFAVNYLVRTLNIELQVDGIKNIMVRCGGIRTPAVNRTEVGIVRQLEKRCDERVDLYRDRLNAEENDLIEFRKHRSSPELAARTILKALRSKRPRTRYQVGYLSGAGAFLESIPQCITDTIMKRR